MSYVTPVEKTLDGCLLGIIIKEREKNLLMISFLKSKIEKNFQATDSRMVLFPRSVTNGLSLLKRCGTIV
jgi:hypothetical protein